MAGNKEGAKKAAETNKRKHGADFYKIIGAKSWDNPDRSRKTGFALNPELAVEAGRKGGKKTKSDYKTQEGYQGQDYIIPFAQEAPIALFINSDRTGES
jgi:general stress protein YciG